MISATRAEVMRLLAELSETLPGMRFGQLVANLSYLGREFTNEAIWEIEDAELLAAARQMLKDSEEAADPAELDVVRGLPTGVPSTSAH